MAKKINTTQIRPSISVDTLIILEALSKGEPLGLTIERLLNESPTFLNKKEQLNLFKENTLEQEQLEFPFID